MAMLIMVVGLPGTGKSTFARELARTIDGNHFNTDMIRDSLNLRGSYDKESKQRVYDELLLRTKETLKSGGIAIVDGTFYLRSLRKTFIDLAEKIGKPIQWIVLEASESVIKERVSQKRTYSEADFEVYKTVKEQYEPIEEPHLTLKSDEQQLSDMVVETKAHLLQYEF